MAPWESEEPELLRQEFVRLASTTGANITELCHRFHISRKTGYKWLERSKRSQHLKDRSRRPKTISYRVPKHIIDKILSARDLHPQWGAKKLRQYLIMQGTHASELPAHHTVNKILKRHGLITRAVSRQHQPFQRFERSSPNQLWQMDFKGYFSLSNGSDCHPLTIIDDCSRFAVCVAACLDEKFNTVKNVLIRVFMRYGLPDELLIDNGACWKPLNRLKYSEITIWLMRLGIVIIHSHPYHPQTRGKNERFHRTLKEELINNISMKNIDDCQKHFDFWRYTYNHQRPHEAIDMKTPASRYMVSARSYPTQLPPIHYPDGDIIRQVDFNGYFYFERLKIRAGKEFRGLPVAIRQSNEFDQWNVFFCQQKIGTIQIHVVGEPTHRANRQDQL